MKTLLVPLDGSEFAEQTLGSSLDRFKPVVWKLILLYCMDLNRLQDRSAGAPPVKVKELEEVDRQHHQIYLDRLLQDLRARGYSATSLIVHGEPIESILRVAEVKDVDEIVLTTHGRRGWSRLLLGSVAEGVLRRTTRPLTVIPSSKSGSDIVLAIDSDDPDNISMIEISEKTSSL